MGSYNDKEGRSTYESACKDCSKGDYCTRDKIYNNQTANTSVHGAQEPTPCGEDHGNVTADRVSSRTIDATTVTLAANYGKKASPNVRNNIYQDRERPYRKDCETVPAKYYLKSRTTFGADNKGDLLDMDTPQALSEDPNVRDVITICPKGWYCKK